MQRPSPPNHMHGRLQLICSPHPRPSPSQLDPLLSTKHSSELTNTLLAVLNCLSTLLNLRINQHRAIDPFIPIHPPTQLCPFPLRSACNQSIQALAPLTTKTVYLPSPVTVLIRKSLVH